MNADSATPLQFQKCQYDKMERAMFDYIESVSDEFFISVPKQDMNEAIGYFLEKTHERMHTAMASVLGQVCRGMGKDH